MQEPLFGAFLHHFLSNPRKAARIRGARRIARVCPAALLTWRRLHLRQSLTLRRTPLISAGDFTLAEPAQDSGRFQMK